MKPAKACQQCRTSKRKCVESPKAAATACLPCHQRYIECSKSSSSRQLTSARLQQIVPSEPTRELDGSSEATNTLLLSPQTTNEFVHLYIRFIHDRPHTLFHEKTLWVEIHAGTISECLLLAICATGCRFSSNPDHSHLATALRVRSSLLFSQQLESITLLNVQTCILLANLYAAEEDNALEALYFGIANRMAHILRLHQYHPGDTPILKEIKSRTWWSLFMADRWCPPGFGLPREIVHSQNPPELPMDEVLFQSMEHDAKELHNASGNSYNGLWRYMITLVDVLGPIQDLNHSLVESLQPKYAIDQRVRELDARLQSWYESLPANMLYDNENLNQYENNRHGGTFIALHLGYHHYCTLLYFHYLDDDASPTSTPNMMKSPETALYANKCRAHAIDFSRTLHHARQQQDCHVVYLTVAHMIMVSSSVLLHILLFSADSSEVETARLQLTCNFEALIELKKYWPHVDTITRRLLTFQNACLRSTNRKTHKVDRWMVRFLLEHALPLAEKELTGNEHVQQIPSENYEAYLALTPNHEISMERTAMLSDAFADLCRQHEI